MLQFVPKGPRAQTDVSCEIEACILLPFLCEDKASPLDKITDRSLSFFRFPFLVMMYQFT
jgi:hypothetical protein